MSESFAFQATARTSTGTGSARAARRDGKVPASIHSAGKPPIHAVFSAHEIGLRFAKRSFKNTVFDVVLDGKKIKVIPHEVQLDRVSDKPDHIDFTLVTGKDAVKVLIPVIITNQAKAPGIKRGGTLNVVRREIEFFCQPDSIPEVIEIDITGMEIGHSKHINEVALPTGVKPYIKRNFTVATITGKGGDEDPAAVAQAAQAATAAAPAAAKPAAGAKAAPAKPAAKK